MSDTEIIKQLWDASNLITGFVAVQSLAFSYACAKKDFGDAINTRKAKLMIFLIIGAMTLGYCLAILWCGHQAATLDQPHASIYWQAAVGRSLFVVGMTGFSFVALYARQVFSKVPFRH